MPALPWERHPQGAPQSLCPPGHDGSALAEPQLSTAGAPGTRSAAHKRSCRPGAPGEDPAAPRGHCPSPPHTLSHLRGQGLWCVHRHSEMGGEEGPSLLLLLLSRRFLANPGAGGTEPLRAGPVAPRLHPHTRPRTQRPPLAQPGSPTASTGGSPISSTGPDGAPRGCSPGSAGRVERGETRGHTDTDAAVAQLRVAAQPRPRRGRAGTFLLGGRSPLTPSRSPCRPHSPRPHRARPGADRARRPPTRTEPTAPPPPAACSLPLYPAGTERHLL